MQANGLIDKHNGKTLEFLGFTDNIQINVNKKNRNEFKQEELLDTKNQLTEKAKNVFIEIFNRFSSDGKMSLDQCIEFTKIATGIFISRIKKKMIKKWMKIIKE